MIHEMGILWLVLQFFHLISMRLPDSVSIFTAEIWAVVKSLEEIKNSVASKNTLFLQTHFCVPKLYNV